MFTKDATAYGSRICDCFELEAMFKTGNTMRAGHGANSYNKFVISRQRELSSWKLSER